METELDNCCPMCGTTFLPEVDGSCCPDCTEKGIMERIERVVEEPAPQALDMPEVPEVEGSDEAKDSDSI